ncbi:MAG: DUF4488 domain-containing protein [Bacteroidales bacterium]|nr:DUF4488 domain-containing protein [Bacteroidales bacterium]
MKKIIFVFFLFIGLTSAQAENRVIESNSTVGFWQHIRVTKNADGTNKVAPSGIYKVINADSTFFSFMTSPTGSGLALTMFGSYKVTSDSTYTENVQTSLSALGLPTKNNELRYKLVDKNTLFVQFHVLSNDTWTPEIWVRVTMKEMNTGGMVTLK